MFAHNYYPRQTLDAETFSNAFALTHRHPQTLCEIYVEYPSGRARVQRIPEEVVIDNVYKNTRKRVPLHYTVFFEGAALAQSLPSITLDQLDALVASAK